MVAARGSAVNAASSFAFAQGGQQQQVSSGSVVQAQVPILVLGMSYIYIIGGDDLPGETGSLVQAQEEETFRRNQQVPSSPDESCPDPCCTG